MRTLLSTSVLLALALNAEAQPGNVQPGNVVVLQDPVQDTAIWPMGETGDTSLTPAPNPDDPWPNPWPWPWPPPNPDGPWLNPWPGPWLPCNPDDPWRPLITRVDVCLPPPFDDGAPEPADHRTAVLEYLDAAGRSLAAEPADHWTAALEHLAAAGRSLAAAKVDATLAPELTPDAAADVERAALAVHRALEAIGEAAAEVRVGRALSAFVRGAEPAESLGR